MKNTVMISCIVISWISPVNLVAAETVSRAGTSPLAATPGDSVLIPAGEFLMGREGGAYDNPQHKVYVDSFYMDTYEVTNAQYLEFCQKTGHRLPDFWGMKEFHSGPTSPNNPVVGVGWRDATEYAEWCGKRLPTEAEWEYAARGGFAGKAFPGGDTLTAEMANCSPSEGTTPVGSFPANGYGLHEMAGNVAEWVADVYDREYYKAGPYRNPKGPSEGKFRVIRGGGWHSGPSCNRVDYRNCLVPQWLDVNVGFRCARDAVARGSQTQPLASAR